MSESYDDQKSALLNFIRSLGLTATFPTLEISAALPTGTPHHFISALRQGGTFANDNYPDQHPRFDLWCCASTLYEAQRLWGALVPYLIPQPPLIVGFRLGGVACTHIAMEAGPIDSAFPRIGWPAIFSSIRLGINPGVTI